MDITVEKEQNRLIVTVDGDIDYMNVSELKKELNRRIENGTQNIILNMEDVHHIDSMAIGLFAVTQKKLRGSGGQFSLVNVRSDVNALLKLSSVDRMLKIYESMDDIPQ